MKRFYLAAALAASALTATAASAAPTFNVAPGPANFSIVTAIAGAGIPGSPATISGVVNYSSLINGASTNVSGFNVAINGNNYADFAAGVTAMFTTPDGSNGTLSFISGAATIFSFDLTNLFSADNAGGLPSGGNTVSTATQFNYTGSQISIEAGSAGKLAFTSAAVAAVPEPATWAMMLVGFGMMGASMRYRRKSTAVSFA